MTRNKWIHWHLVTWVNPDSNCTLVEGHCIGLKVVNQNEWPSMTEDGRDYCCGAKLKKLCKLPADMHIEHPKEANSIIEKYAAPLRSPEVTA